MPQEREDSVQAAWEHFHHVADVGVRGRGATLAEAFRQAAVALTAVITEPCLVRPEQEIVIHCEAPDAEYLLVDWLNALIYEMAVRHMLFSRFEVELEEGQLQGRAWGERVDQARHAPAVEVKGATFTALHVRREADGAWVAGCVVDV